MFIYRLKKHYNHSWDPQTQEIKNRTVSLKNEIHALRNVIRQREYLFHPEEERSHVSIDGIGLDYDLINFSQLDNIYLFITLIYILKQFFVIL